MKYLILALALLHTSIYAECQVSNSRVIGQNETQVDQGQCIVMQNPRSQFTDQHGNMYYSQPTNNGFQVTNPDGSVSYYYNYGR
jgi:hypothetical protein